MSLSKIYAAKQNTDTTEGKGWMKTFAYFQNPEDAVEAVKGRGVMGAGDGEVYEVTVSKTLEEWNEHGPYKETKIYGYHKSITGRWRDGWVDDRDLPHTDPEFAEYVRLKKKFDPE